MEHHEELNLETIKNSCGVVINNKLFVVGASVVVVSKLIIPSIKNIGTSIWKGKILPTLTVSGGFSSLGTFLSNGLNFIFIGTIISTCIRAYSEIKDGKPKGETIAKAILDVFLTIGIGLILCNLGLELINSCNAIHFNF
jgi:large-conductance mechanosensitive channel